MPQSRIPYSAANCLDELPTLRASSLTGPDAMFVHSMRPWKKAYASTRKSPYAIIFNAIDTHQQARGSPHAGFERRRSRKECVLAAQLMPADKEFSGEDHASTRSRREGEAFLPSTTAVRMRVPVRDTEEESSLWCESGETPNIKP